LLLLLQPPDGGQELNLFHFAKDHGDPLLPAKTDKAISTVYSTRGRSPQSKNHDFDTISSLAGALSCPVRRLAMPFYLPPVNRRRFLGGAIAALLAKPLAAMPIARSDSHGIALLADTHVAADKAAVFKYVFMATHLSAVVKEVLDYKERPTGEWP
jgi:hypothetical protein